METKTSKSNVEVTTLSPVPPEEKKSWLSVAFMQAGIMICVPSLLLGGILAQAMPLSNAIIAGIIGYLIVILIFSLMGIMGSDLSVPTCVTMLSSFWPKGNTLSCQHLDFYIHDRLVCSANRCMWKSIFKLTEGILWICVSDMAVGFNLGNRHADYSGIRDQCAG